MAHVILIKFVPDLSVTIQLIEKLSSWLTKQRLSSDRFEVPDDLAKPNQVLVYRTCFDKDGFYDMERLNSGGFEHLRSYREAYRKMWLDDVGGV